MNIYVGHVAFDQTCTPAVRSYNLNMIHDVIHIQHLLNLIIRRQLCSSYKLIYTFHKQSHGCIIAV